MKDQTLAPLRRKNHVYRITRLTPTARFLCLHGA